MSGSATTLPDFGDPPVIETALGVEFAPLEKWGIPHFGIFWEALGPSFDEFEVQPPLVSQIEQFGKTLPSPRVQFSFNALAPEVRCWFKNAKMGLLLQVQNSRLILNWRKTADGGEYPRYEKLIRPQFANAWGQFTEFVKSRNLGAIDVLQCEVTYVNHILLGEGWRSAADLPDVFPSWSGRWSGTSLPQPESVVLGASFLFPAQQGRLRINLQPALREADAAEVLQLTLTARGKPASSEVDAIMNWMDVGREWIVRGFADFTSPKMHKIWKRRT